MKVSKEYSLKTEADKLFQWIIVLEKNDRYSENTSLERDKEFLECERRVLRMTGCRSPWELTERSPVWTRRGPWTACQSDVALGYTIPGLQHPTCISVQNQRQQRLQALPLCITINFHAPHDMHNINKSFIPFSFKKNNWRTEVTCKTHY